MKKFKSIALLALTAVLTMSAAVSAYASDSVVDIDSAGNVFSAEEIVKDDAHFAGFGVGQNVNYRNVDIEDTLTLAGYNVKVSGSTVGSSVFAAGYNVDIEDDDIDGNIIAAGYTIDINEGTKANAVMATGFAVTFSGEAKAAHIAASSVVIDGVIDGDADISADNVTISDDAVINGKLVVSSANEPDLGNAQVGSFEFNKTENEQTAEVEAKQSIGSKILDKVKSAIYWAIAMSIVALLMSLLVPGRLNDAVIMVKTRPGAMLGSGAITLFAFPIAAIIVAITYIGLPLAAISALVFTLILVLSVTFAGASLGRLVFAKINPIFASVCGVAILEVVKQIPFVGGLVFFAATVFTLGYFIQALWSVRLKKSSTVVEAKAIVDSVETETVIEE